ncbi:hypothetical protein [Nocardioides sp. SYSU D00038]|uniref:divisome protein SepX/GlpR n=1 Tax=Nocardioides sp. SYSU D00038 TaxID=2812554 RepID=UPI0019673CDC|nr:hypothetical protein [Nocardioides sp. SYSU D00038]
MDPSALIFVALAVAWAVYLIPKALDHHEEGARGRTVDRFSDRMRVLARREPVGPRASTLVPAGQPAPPTPREARRAARAEARREREREAAAREAALTPEQRRARERARRQAAVRAAHRRLRVVTLILLGLGVTAGFAWLGTIGWPWVGVPAGVLALWLVACRLMVRRERAAAPGARIPADTPSPDDDATETIAAVEAEPVAAVVVADPDPTDPRGWAPVDVPLPTYVTKPVATRAVRTIDLDSTGVWSSGRSEADSALVRDHEASESAKARPDQDGQAGSEAVGS